MNSPNNFPYVDLLPPSLKKDVFLLALAEAIEIEFKQIREEFNKVSNFVNIDDLPEGLLDYLAYQRHVDFYEFDLPIEQKRELIKNSIAWHRKKGTPWAVEKVASIVFPSADVVEWFDYDGKPYTFKVEVEQPFVASKDIRRLKDVVESTKNKRSHLESIAIKMKEQSIIVSHNSTHSTYPLPITNAFYTAATLGKGFENNNMLHSKVIGGDNPLPICGAFYTE